MNANNTVEQGRASVTSKGTVSLCFSTLGLCEATAVLSSTLLSCEAVVRQWHQDPEPRDPLSTL